MTDYRNNRAIVYFPLLTFILYCHCDKYKVSKHTLINLIILCTSSRYKIQPFKIIVTCE